MQPQGHCWFAIKVGCDGTMSKEGGQVTMKEDNRVRGER
jgi:hypothetical protein